VKELDDLIAFLESRIPANPESPQNLKLAKVFEKDLNSYFKDLENALPVKKIEQIYTKYAEQG